MTTAEIASLAPILARYKPAAAPVDAYCLKRRKVIRESMARLRARRKAAGLNNAGKPMKLNLGSPRSKILPGSKAHFAEKSSQVKPASGEVRINTAKFC